MKTKKEEFKENMRVVIEDKKGEGPVATKTDDIGPGMRQIIIETDGNNINIIKAEVGGYIEFVGILQNIIDYIRSKNNNVTKNDPR